MMNQHFKRSLRTFFWVSVLALAGPMGFAQKTLELRSESIPQVPHLYTILDFVDERPQKSAIGSVIQTSGQSTALRFSGSVPVTLQRILRQSASGTLSVRVRVKQLWFDEKLSGQVVRGNFRVQLIFERPVEGRYITLTECQAGADYSRSRQLEGTYEIQLRQTLERCFREFGQWVKNNDQHTEKLARRVQIRFKDYTPTSRLGDTVFYSPSRKLTWKDFRGPIRRTNPNTGAMIYTSFGYEAFTKVEKGTVIIEMTVKDFMLQHSSWTAEPETDTYALAHEQLHFDITHLVAERFKRNLLAEELPLEDYDSRIQYIFLESFREMNRVQEQYDAETRHSINRSEQARWALKVRTELNQLNQ